MTTIRLAWTALDCPDPFALASFYSALTGLAIEPLGDLAPDEVTWLELVNPAGPTVAFQKVAVFVAPTWPEGGVPQQAHLDFFVGDLDEGEALARSLGATVHSFQPGGTFFRVFLDPAGHPFCLVQRAEPSPPVASERLSVTV